MLAGIGRRLSSLADVGVAGAGALLGSQFPGYVDTYGTYLRGRLAELRADLAELERDALARGESVADYLAGLAQEGARAAQRAAGYEARLDRADWLETAITTLEAAPFWALPYAFAEAFDRTSAQAVLASYVPEVSLEPATLGFAILGLLVLLLPYKAVTALAAVPFRRRAA